VLAFPHVIDFLAHEFACLRGRRLSFASVFPRAFQSFLIIRGRHYVCSLLDGLTGTAKNSARGSGSRPSPHALSSQGTQLPFIPCADHFAGERRAAEYGLIPKPNGELLYARKWPSGAAHMPLNEGEWLLLKRGRRGCRFSATAPFGGV
jgi:hypothetical protein